MNRRNFLKAAVAGLAGVVGVGAAACVGDGPILVAGKWATVTGPGSVGLLTPKQHERLMQGELSRVERDAAEAEFDGIIHQMKPLPDHVWQSVRGLWGDLRLVNRP
jgi:hypothetical protein